MVSVSVMLFCTCTISNTCVYQSTGPNSKLNLTAIYALMDSSFWFGTINLGKSIVYIKGSQVIISKQKYISFSEDILCVTDFEFSLL